MPDKKYWHELSQEEVDALVSSGKTWGDIMQEYQQPAWCGYLDALAGQVGCWSLVDYVKGGGRERISLDFCKGCECFKNNT